jgi:DNA-directed RNA polymerase specialized sigma24 family protein
MLERGRLIFATLAQMNKKWDLTQESFDNLLAWLDPNRDRAGDKYEEIRRRLIKIFTCRGCVEAESLADETINRVIRKLREIVETYTGDQALYFYGVAHKVHLEYLRRKPEPEPPPQPPTSIEPSEEVDQELDCLEQCIQRLTQANRELVLQYYQEEKQAKIDHRKVLADQLGIALNALRIRAYRIRTTLQQCVEQCVEQSAA